MRVKEFCVKREEKKRDMQADTDWGFCEIAMSSDSLCWVRCFFFFCSSRIQQVLMLCAPHVMCYIFYFIPIIFHMYFILVLPICLPLLLVVLLLLLLLLLLYCCNRCCCLCHVVQLLLMENAWTQKAPSRTDKIKTLYAIHSYKFPVQFAVNKINIHWNRGNEMENQIYVPVHMPIVRKCTC